MVVAPKVTAEPLLRARVLHCRVLSTRVTASQQVRLPSQETTCSKGNFVASYTAEVRSKAARSAGILAKSLHDILAKGYQYALSVLRRD